MRRDLADVIASVRAVGVDDLAITTNLALLSPKRAEALASAGLRRINISLDTLDAERFKALGGGAPITPVLDGVEPLSSTPPGCSSRPTPWSSEVKTTASCLQSPILCGRSGRTPIY